jgi:hypothetical protein
LASQLVERSDAQVTFTVVGKRHLAQVAGRPMRDAGRAFEDLEVPPGVAQDHKILVQRSGSLSCLDAELAFHSTRRFRSSFFPPVKAEKTTKVSVLVIPLT